MKLIKNKYRIGSKASIKEDYKTLVKGEKAYQGLSNPFFARKLIIIALVVGFSVFDGMLLFTIFDEILTQNAYISYITAIAISALLNIIPLIIAWYIKKLMYKTERFALIYIIIAVLAFAALYGSTVYLRFSMEDMYEQQSLVSENLFADNEGNQVDAGEDEISARAESMTILLSIAPLITSTLGLILSLITDDELKKKIQFLRIRLHQMRQFESELKVIVNTINYEQEVLINYDDLMYESARDGLYALRQLLKARARVVLAEYLKNPNDTSILLDAEEETTGPENVAQNEELHLVELERSDV